ATGQAAESALPAWGEEIAEEDDQARSTGSEAVQALFEIGRLANACTHQWGHELRRVEVFEEGEHRASATAPPCRTEVAGVGCQGPDKHTVGCVEGDVAKGCRQASGIAELGWLGPIDGSAGVHEDMNVEHLFFFVQAHEEGVGAAVDVPVHAGWVIALDVVAVISEFEARALAE